MVEGYTFLCKECRNVFRLPSKDRCSLNKETRCPKCGSADFTEAPAWAPLDSGFNIFEDLDWEYECQECHKKFKMPIPKSPTEEKARKCQYCGAGHIHRLTDVGGQPLYCG